MTRLADKHRLVVVLIGVAVAPALAGFLAAQGEWGRWAAALIALAALAAVIWALATRSRASK